MHSKTRGRGRAMAQRRPVRDRLDRSRCLTSRPSARAVLTLARVSLIAGVLGSLLLAPRLANAASGPRLLQARAFAVTSGSSVSVTLRKPNGAGNLIVAYVVWDAAGTVTLTDSRGNSYASAIGPAQASGD